MQIPLKGIEYHQWSRSSHVIAKDGLLLIVCLLLFSAISTAWFITRQISMSIAPAEALPPVFSAQTVAPAVAEPVEEAEETPPSLDDLDTELKAWIAARPNQQWSVVVHGVNGDTRSLAIDPDKKYEAASIYKLLMTYPLVQKVPFAEQDTRMILVGDQMRSVASCVDVMLRLSDNPCGQAIGYYVGWGKADKVLNAAGYPGVHLNRSDHMVATAGDTAKFLVDLYEGRLVEAAYRDHILAILDKQIFNQGLKKGCTDCRVMNKIGDYNGVRHDAGVVEYAGGEYVISVFSQGGSYAQIAEIAKIVHRHMALAP